jgi:hypothetical protein
MIRIVLMTADAAVEYASYAQIGSSFNQFRHISWLAISYIISVTITQPLVCRVNVNQDPDYTDEIDRAVV